MRLALGALGFILGSAVLLPLMLVFDEARPLLAGLGVAAAAALYAWGRHRRLRGQ